MNDSETSLKSMLDEKAQGALLSHDFVQSTHKRARRARSRRRVALGVSLFALVAAPSAVIWQSDLLGGGDPKSTVVAGPTDSPSTSTTASVPATGVSTWLSGLEQEGPVSVAYVSKGNLHIGKVDVRIPGNDVGLIGPVHGGWLVLVEVESSAGMKSEYRVINEAGESRVLPQVEYQAQEQAISPDGTLVAYGSVVVEVATGRVVESLPSNADYLVAWTDQGVVFRDAAGDSWLWRSPGAAVRLDAPIAQVFPWSKYAVTIPRNGCNSLVSIGSDGSERAAYTGCGDQMVSSPSPGGDYILSRGGRVLSSSTKGDLLPALPTDVVVPRLAAWEDATHVIFPLATATDPSQGSSADSAQIVIVRCDVSAGTCGRAGSAVDGSKLDRPDLTRGS
jgi:hypothetical protein